MRKWVSLFAAFIIIMAGSQVSAASQLTTSQPEQMQPTRAAGAGLGEYFGQTASVSVVEICFQEHRSHRSWHAWLARYLPSQP